MRIMAAAQRRGEMANQWQLSSRKWPAEAGSGQ
jgi:hypothetical protein